MADNAGAVFRRGLKKLLKGHVAAGVGVVRDGAQDDKRDLIEHADLTDRRPFHLAAQPAEGLGKFLLCLAVGNELIPGADPPLKNLLLRRGDSGEPVKWLQYELIAHGYLRETELDGDFGVITLGAVLAFQLEHGLSVDGICGPETRSALAEQ